MKYDLKNPVHIDRFKKRTAKMIESGILADLTEVKYKRTLPQNRYLHLILGWFACETGHSLTEVKEGYFKAMVNREIFVTEFIDKQTGEVIRYMRSTKDLNTKEMTEAIDRFRNWSSIEAGIYIPEANEHEYIKYIQMEIDKNKEYL